MPVQKGNRIFIAEGDISAKANTVEWQQSLSHKSDTYYMVIFTNEDQNKAQSYMFIQKDRLEALKAKSSGNRFTITVDDAFQYGQKNAQGEGRFLVYHDKSRNPYQWRFVASLWSKLGNGAISLLELAPVPPPVKDISKYFSGFIGDPLRNF